MKRIRPLWIASSLLLAAGITFAAGTTIMSVQIRKAELRDTPSFLGKIVAGLGYGDKVTVDRPQGAWMRVTASGQAGWIHSSALTTKTIVMKAGDGAQTAASSGEMALAGKGFNSDVEAKFKASHKDINFAPVDRMEKIKVPTATLQAFATAGGLKMSEGVAQ
jgi:uncharacterized protein YgiM (DUF1202 family)